MAGAEPGATAGGSQLRYDLTASKAIPAVGAWVPGHHRGFRSNLSDDPNNDKVLPSKVPAPSDADFGNAGQLALLVATLHQGGLGWGNGRAEDRQQAIN